MRAGGSPTASASTALAAEEQIAHLVLWADGDRYRALPADAAEAFARCPPATRGARRAAAPCPMGTAHEEALAALSSRLLAEFAERGGGHLRRGARALGSLGRGRPCLGHGGRWRRLGRPGRARARRSHDEVDLPLRDRRALLERAEREYRRRLEELRALEALRYGEKDRALAELKRRAQPKEKRTLVATAYWRCG